MVQIDPCNLSPYNNEFVAYGHLQSFPVTTDTILANHQYLSWYWPLPSQFGHEQGCLIHSLDVI